MKQYFVYIMSNTSGTLYIGITNNLARRVYKHKAKEIAGFTKRYNIDRLVYFEQFQMSVMPLLEKSPSKSGGEAKRLSLLTQ